MEGVNSNQSVGLIPGFGGYSEQSDKELPALFFADAGLRMVGLYSNRR
jgi:hypothetical protein